MVVEEKYSKYWIQISIGLGLLTLLFLAGYSLMEDVLLEGILRLIAFASLAATVFSGLKVMQGKHTITVDVDDEDLVLSYTKNNREISRDIFRLQTIGKLYVETSSHFWTLSIFPNDLNVKFVPVDSDRALNLLEIKGRPLAFTKENADRIIEYVQKHAPNAYTPNEP